MGHRLVAQSADPMGSPVAVGLVGLVVKARIEWAGGANGALKQEASPHQRLHVWMCMEL